jgi:hypothetical protein
MSTPDDDDILAAPIPDPNAEATPAERAHAKTFAAIVDKTLAGRTPPAMSADDRALLEVATVIRAANGNLELAPGKTRSIVEDALRQAIGGAGASMGGASVTPIGRGRARRYAPWLVGTASTLIAAAAVLLLWLRPARQTVAVPRNWQSRPSDPLVGKIPKHEALTAVSDRMDYIFADRLDGYRERRFALSGGKP